MSSADTSNLISALRAQLPSCMQADRARFAARLRSLHRKVRDEQRRARICTEIEKEIAASIEKRERRASSHPTPTFEQDLPVNDKRADIAALIRDHQVIVLCGETGSGKTTQLPKICLELGRGIDAMIGHTQPRRIAARSVADRIAEELGQSLGRHVGYKVRFDDQTGDDCRVKVMTDGILLAETQHDRDLRGYDTLIIDEAHERSLNIDFLIGYLKQLLPRRPDLKVIITSATIDPQRFSEHFNNAPIIEVSGRTYPVDVRYRPLHDVEEDEAPRDMVRGILESTDELISAGKGDILVFLPGEREILDTAKALRGHVQKFSETIEILPLYARLSTKMQHRVFESHRGRRIVLATNVAETSITVPGIRYVIDTGLARISRYSARRKVQLLPVEMISQASADQRAGRCGRVAEGICIRLYDQERHETRPEFTDPEIVRTNLASVLLQMHALKLGRIQKFPFIDPPRRGMIRDGIQTLHELGALDDKERLTELGRQLARLPVDPRIGRMIFAGHDEECLREALIIAAALSSRDPRDRPQGREADADTKHERFAHDHSDFIALLRIWNFYHDQKEHLSWNKLRKCCEENYLSFVRMREWTEIHRQLQQLARDLKLRFNREKAHEDAIHRAVLTGLLSNIGVNNERRAYTGAGGKEFWIWPGSNAFDVTPRWIVGSELVETTRLYARNVARIQPEWLERIADHLIARTYADPTWNPKQGRVMANERVSLFGLEIVSKRRAHYGPVNPQRSREIFIEHALVAGEYITDAPFFEHNRKIISGIRNLQSRSRRRDLLVDDSVRHAFYDDHLPADIYSTRRFEKWLRKAGRGKPEFLFMTREDLMLHAASGITVDRYPDFMSFGEARFALDYRFEPGHEADGLTVIVPLELVGQLNEQRLQWLVPGYLIELVTAVMRTLPKSIRRNFVPAAHFAEACVANLSFGEGSLTDAMARELQKLRAVDIPKEAWRPDDIEPWLRANIRVVDGEGRVVVEDRDLRAIRDRVGHKARQAFAATDQAEWSHTGMTEWSCGRVPEVIEVQRNGMTLKAHPALVDEGSTVGTRLFEQQGEAERHHVAGVRRFLLRQLKGEIADQVRNLPAIDSIRMNFALLGTREALNDALQQLIIQRAMIDDRTTVRSADELESRINDAYPGLWSVALDVARDLDAILAALLELHAALDVTMPPQWEPSVIDVRDQLDRLTKPGFLLETPSAWLRQYPRYLSAMTMRLERLARGGYVRDQQRMDELLEYWIRFEQFEDDHRARHLIDPELELLRWMLEEWRVATFAQELGTAIQVSEKRIRKQLEKVTR